MPRYKGGLIGGTAPIMSNDATPDWMRSLLPDGGKVSVTVHSGPSTGGITAASVDPRTGVALQPGQAPMPAAAPAPTSTVSAMRAVTPNTAVNPNQNDPNGPQHPTPPGTPPPDPHATAAITATGYQWWNPYHGKYEPIPGVNNKGIVVDANAFWNYYTHYPSSVLDVFANKLASGNNPATWQHQYTDQEIANMVQGNSDYITGLGGINNNRFQELLQFGEITPEQAKAFGLTPDQIKAIRENPVSDLNNIRRQLTSGIYERNASSAAHGAYNSGVRFNDIGNLQSEAIRQQLTRQQALNAGLESENQHVQDLFRSVKDQMEQEGGFDPGDTEHNKAAWEATHKTITAAGKTGGDLLKHIGDPMKMKSVNDLRGVMGDIDKYLKQFGNLISPGLKAQLLNLRARADKHRHELVMARQAAHYGTVGNSSKSTSSSRAQRKAHAPPPSGRPTGSITSLMRRTR